MDGETGLAAVVKSHAHVPSRIFRQSGNKIGGESERSNMAQRLAAAWVGADRAYQIGAMPEFRGVGGKIEGSATQMFGFADHVPQNFADADEIQRDLLEAPCELEAPKSNAKLPIAVYHGNAQM